MFFVLTDCSSTAAAIVSIISLISVITDDISFMLVTVVFTEPWIAFILVFISRVEEFVAFASSFISPATTAMPILVYLLLQLLWLYLEQASWFVLIFQKYSL